MSASDGGCWVVFDLGETLVDETRNWAGWANYIGVPELTFFAVMGAVIANGRPHTDAFLYFRPGFSLADEVPRKAAADCPGGSMPTISTRTRCPRSRRCVGQASAWP